MSEGAEAGNQRPASSRIYLLAVFVRIRAIVAIA
jgi:hypothetical protein